MLSSLRVIFLFSLLFSGVAFTKEEAPLDPSPGRITPILESDTLFRLDRFNTAWVLSANDLADVIGLQTPVKSQSRRGTCGIFSATGMVESLLKMHFKEELDLAENYLEYVVQNWIKPYPSAGAEIDQSVPAFQKWGAIGEATWPYEEYDWEKTDLPEEESLRKKATCGHLSGRYYTGCVISHKDPYKDNFAGIAAEMARKYQTQRLWYRPLASQDEIRGLLAQGYPLILSIEFFYGAWNHRLMVEYGIGERNMALWDAGVVGTPTQFDISISRQHAAGHSIILVGYDDQKRVYYFKNSWGKDGFGKKSDLLGPDSTAGYGTIPYEYAHWWGKFFDVYQTDEQGYVKRRK